MTAQLTPSAAHLATRGTGSIRGDARPAGGGPVTAKGQLPPPTQPTGRRWLGRGLCASGILMIPWLFVLGSHVPDITLVRWSTAWLGLDGFEAVCLIATGILLRRRDGRACLAAAVTATVLLIDAWFDVTTAISGADRAVALAMAIFAELPLSALCMTLAVRLCRAAHHPAAQHRTTEDTHP